jgi:thiol-disulfide isomerase/thioredoxin
MVNRNSLGRFKPKPLLDVRNSKQVKDFKQLVLNGPLTFVLIYADWCGHCHRYMPKFKKLAQTPGRVVNMAAVNETMVKSIPEIANAKISGYPSVIQVTSDGEVKEYKVPGSAEKTNVVPEMNDEEVMKTLVTAVNTASRSGPMNRGTPGYQGVIPGDVHFLEKNVEEQRGGNWSAADFKASNVALAAQVEQVAAADGSCGPQPVKLAGGALESVFGAFAGAINAVGPAALLLAAHEMLPKSWGPKKGGARKRRLTYKSPKKANHRASTRRNRRGH